MNILGIHGGVAMGQHEPNAALVVDGELVAACEEERFLRIKTPRGFLPINAITACLRQAGLDMRDIDLVVHPGETYEDMPARIRHYCYHFFGYVPEIRMLNHQLAHLASAFFASGFDSGMCLSYDAWGDRLSAALAIADKVKGIRILETRPAENSLGTFYSTMTSYLGFQTAEDEYKVMGLAAFATDGPDLSPFIKVIPQGYEVDPSFVRNDPPIRSVFEPHYSQRLVKLLGPPRRPDQPLNDHFRRVARATQTTMEACAISLVTHLHKLTECDSLCIAGGVGLNCAANGKLARLPFVRRLFVQPAASDRGLGLGCALQAAFEEGSPVLGLKHVYTGPTYADSQILQALRQTGVAFRHINDPAEEGSRLLERGKIIGWYHGRSEYGPRALGSRSILADPRDARMKDQINSRIKYREEFRPFAPAALSERAPELFDLPAPSPFMTVAHPVREQWRERLAAVTHVDGTARVQTVDAATAPAFHHLIRNFGNRTGVPAVLNTSFNIKGQPIAETPLDALATFAATGMDALVIGPYLVEKAESPAN